jgi:hypothetical protein
MSPTPFVALCAVLLSPASAPLSRRAHLAAAAAVVLAPTSALAAKDCFLDCTQNCNRVAPGSARYCESSCAEYCEADDRRDGLSGSVSADGAEVGWASAYDLKARVTGQQRGVPYGEDRPPALPDVFKLAPTLRAVTGQSKVAQ